MSFAAGRKALKTVEVATQKVLMLYRVAALKTRQLYS